MDLLAAIRERRTLKAFTGAGIPRATVEGLVEAACWAPNHRLTQPWRFAAIDQAGIGRLVTLLQAPPVSATVEARKLPAICERLVRCAALIQVTFLQRGSAEQRLEDRDATAAALQNLLLAAHGQGLGAFWSTSPLMAHPAVLQWFGSDPGSCVHVGTVWLGIPAEPGTPPRRLPLPEVFRWA